MISTKYTLTFVLSTVLLMCFASGPVSAQPPWGGGGGDRGGRGGFGGGRGGGDRGGFDPSSFLDRLDRNGNGVLDPDEQEGPAQFLIRRMQSSDSSIEVGKPIPINKIKEGFDSMRREREGGGDSDRDGGRDRGRGDDRGRDRGRRGDDSAGDEALIAELLVPGFGSTESLGSLMGFGATAELLTSEVSEADRVEAKKRIAYFDKNKDGVLSKDELTSQFAGNPLDFDRNRDGRLTMDELAVRYARRREGAEEARRENSRDRESKDAGRRTETEVPDIYNGRKSYRAMSERSRPEGLPGFFAEKDSNGDGQISMAEFTDEWTDESVNQFLDSDFNSDGVITADEAMRAVEEGTVSQLMASSNIGGSQSFSASSSMATESSVASSPALSGGPIDPKYISVAERIIKRRDKNNDGMLTPSEWKTMLMSPADADANRDGKITVEEYARWTISRERS
ncbi:EF-hand domain-containing protein [Rubripirellula amarantea]|nr:EF-hand domain-containing protein [Rubripirellula amarantea]